MKDYARWHRLASESLLAATLYNEARTENLALAKEYCKLASNSVYDDYTTSLNQSISEAIERAIKLDEQSR